MPEAPKELRAITRKAADVARRQKAVDKLRDELEVAIVAAYEAGEVASTLGQAAGLSDSGLLKVLRRRGVEIRSRGRQGARDARGRVNELAPCGCPIADIREGRGHLHELERVV